MILLQARRPNNPPDGRPLVCFGLLCARRVGLGRFGGQRVALWEHWEQDSR